MKKRYSVLLALLMVVSLITPVEASSRWERSFKGIIRKTRESFQSTDYSAKGTSIALFDIDQDGVPEMLTCGDSLGESYLAVFVSGQSWERAKWGSLRKSHSHWFEAKDGRLIYVAKTGNVEERFYINKSGNSITYEITKDKGTSVPLYRNPYDIRGFNQAVAEYKQRPVGSVAGNIKVKLNGKDINFSLPIKKMQNRTFYPFRQLLEAAGVTVAWNPETSTAIARRIKDGEDFMVEFPIGKSTYSVNGVTKNLASGERTFVENGNTYIPVRYAMEGLGFTVDWDSNTDTIIINDQ